MNIPKELSSASASAAGRNDEWACDKCTFLNKLSATQCEVCLTARHFTLSNAYDALSITENETQSNGNKSYKV